MSVRNDLQVTAQQTHQRNVHLYPSALDFLSDQPGANMPLAIFLASPSHATSEMSSSKDLTIQVSNREPRSLRICVLVSYCGSVLSRLYKSDPLHLYRYLMAYTMWARAFAPSVLRSCCPSYMPTRTVTISQLHREVRASGADLILFCAHRWIPSSVPSRNHKDYPEIVHWYVSTEAKPRARKCREVDHGACYHRLFIIRLMSAWM